MIERLYAVWTNDDLSEGRGRQYMKYVCRSKATALRLARRGYVQGSDCPVKEVNLVVVDETAYVPLDGIRIIEPEPEDLLADERAEQQRLTLEKAKSAGLSEEDIAILRGK